MIVLPVKPLTTNRLWKGRQFKTKEYKEYERLIVILLRKMNLSVPKGPVRFTIEVGTSSRFDLDNVLKPILDIVQKHHPAFDDKNVFEIDARKQTVVKGREYIAFKFTSIA